MNLIVTLALVRNSHACLHGGNQHFVALNIFCWYYISVINLLYSCVVIIVNVVCKQYY